MTSDEAHLYERWRLGLRDGGTAHRALVVSAC